MAICLPYASMAHVQVLRFQQSLLAAAVGHPPCEQCCSPVTPLMHHYTQKYSHTQFTVFWNVDYTIGNHNNTS